jgi:hypothetical protein
MEGTILRLSLFKPLRYTGEPLQFGLSSGLPRTLAKAAAVFAARNDVPDRLLNTDDMILSLTGTPGAHPVSEGFGIGIAEGKVVGETYGAAIEVASGSYIFHQFSDCSAERVFKIYERMLDFAKKKGLSVKGSRWFLRVLEEEGGTSFQVLIPLC